MILALNADDPNESNSILTTFTQVLHNERDPNFAT